MTASQIFRENIDVKDVSFANWIEVEKINYENASSNEPFEIFLENKYNADKHAWYNADGETKERNGMILSQLLELAQKGVGIAYGNELAKEEQSDAESDKEAYNAQLELEAKLKKQKATKIILGVIIASALFGGGLWAYKKYQTSKK